ncbi:hypothetical protein HQ400_07800 [Aeromonas jandaei]|nr:hypothetical protein HQ400_07800 [Aeromonas jandaei]
MKFAIGLFKIIRELPNRIISKLRQSASQRAEKKFKSQCVVIPFEGATINQVIAYGGMLYRCFITESDFYIVDFKNDTVADIRTIIEILKLVKQNIKEEKCQSSR